MAFLVIDGIEVPIPRSGPAEQQPDGPGGKRRWAFQSVSLPETTLAPLRAAIGWPSGAESDRAWDGTLFSDRPFVDCTGSAFGGDTVSCEVTVTAETYRHHRDPADCVWRRVSLVLREA